MLNKLLAQEVQKHFGKSADLPESLAAFICSVGESYDRYDENILTLENCVQNCSSELRALNEKLLNETAGLKTAHDELIRIFNQVNEGFFTRDIIANKYVHMSVGCEKIYGYTIQDFFDNASLWYQVIHPDDKIIIDREKEILNKGIQIKTSYRIIHKDKSIRWIEVKAIPALVDGKLTRVDGVVNDITDRKNAEKLITESEIKYRSFFENNMDGVLLSKPNGVILEANPAACEIFGATEAEICSYSREELMNFADTELGSLMEERNRTGNFKGELNLLRRDGTKFRGEIASSLFKDVHSEFRSCIIVRDITERKKAEGLILMNERQLDLIYNTVTDSIFMLSIEEGKRFRFVSVNYSFLENTGLHKQQVIGKYVDEVIPSPSLERVLEKYQQAIITKKTASWEEQTVFPSGIKTGIVHINPVMNDKGDCMRLIGSVRDISEQVKAEVEFKASQRNFQLLVNTIDGIVWEADAETFAFNFVSQRAEVLLGYPVSEWINDVAFWKNHIHPDDRAEAVAFRMKHTKERKSHVFEYRMIAADGHMVWLQDIVSVVFNEDQTCYLRGIMVDITERKKQEQVIREGEEKYRSLVEQASDAIFINTAKGQLLDVNQSACDMLGYPKEALISMNFKDLLSTEDIVLNTVRGDEMWTGEKSLTERNMVHCNGSFVPADISSKMLSDGRIISIVRNITERKKTDKVIKDSQERIKLIMGAALDAIICIDVSDVITFWNPQAEKIFGWKEDEVKGSLLSNLIIPAPYREKHRRGIEKYLKSGQGAALNVLLELRAINRRGQEFPIELTILPIKQGGEEFFCAFIRDITGRKKAEQQISDSESRYRTLFEQNLAGIYQTTPEGKIITCNDAFAAMLGYASPQELIHTSALNLYYTNVERDDFIVKLRNEKKLYNYEVVLKGRNGNPLHMIENISLFTDPLTGEEICEGIMLDITERKKADAMLKESEERYRQIVETAQEGICVVDERYAIIFVNRKMCELFEYSASEMLGKPATFFIGKEDRRLVRPSFGGKYRSLSEKIDLHLTTKSGRSIWTSMSASPILNNEGKFIGGLAMITDITKRKRDEEIIKSSEASLNLKNTELKRKNTELEQFAYIASHDLQEPLRTTSGFVELFQQQYKGRLDVKADKYLQFIVDSVDRMKILIKDLLDYSRIGTKDEQESVDCNKIIKDVLADLGKAITDCNAVIEEGELPVISGYPTEIKQLFQNLIINALKFRKPGEVPHLKISAKISGDHWHFLFADNGIGIDKAHNERIFIIFQRLHTRTEYQGSGIGLSHCKKIVELHQGKIWVESVPGEGSNFQFTIPFRQSI